MATHVKFGFLRIKCLNKCLGKYLDSNARFIAQNSGTPGYVTRDDEFSTGPRSPCSNYTPFCSVNHFIKSC